MTTDRRRPWLALAAVVSLVGIFLSSYTAYTRSHLPPEKYVQLGPGVVGSAQGADFRLLQLRQTSALGVPPDGPAAPDPGATWLVVDMEVTRREPGPVFPCTWRPVTTSLRVWETAAAAPRADGVEYCGPDDAPVGATYRLSDAFQVPTADVSQIAGVALPSYTGGPTLVLTPAS